MKNVMTIDAQELYRFQKAFTEIIATSKRSIADEVFYKARDLAFKLYKQFRTSSILSRNPSWKDPQIMGEALGWRIKAFSRGGVISPRPPLITQTMGMNKRKNRIRYYKSARSGVINKGASFKGVLNKRLDADGFVSTGWLPRIWAKMKRRRELRPVKNKRGSVDISGMDGPMITIVLTNDNPGASEVNQRYGHASKAMAEVSADMENKIKERLEKSLRANIAVGMLR
jgi:hypothetical protein